MEELEIVPLSQIDGMRIFIDRVEYRSPHLLSLIHISEPTRLA